MCFRYLQLVLTQNAIVTPRHLPDCLRILPAKVCPQEAVGAEILRQPLPGSGLQPAGRASPPARKPVGNQSPPAQGARAHAHRRGHCPGLSGNGRNPGRHRAACRAHDGHGTAAAAAAGLAPAAGHVGPRLAAHKKAAPVMERLKTAKPVVPVSQRTRPGESLCPRLRAGAVSSNSKQLNKSCIGW